MFRSMLYRLKGVKKIDELDDKIIFECMKCQSRLIVLKNYGNLHLVCKCGHSCNIYTGRNTRPTTKKDPEIPKELKVFDCRISEYQGRPVIKGKYINQSIYFLKRAIGSFSVGKTEKEVLFFPSLHIEKLNRSEIIEPFEEGVFFHYLSKEEAASIEKEGSTLLNLKFLGFEKSQNKD
ncbi:MAG: hypothetical protein P9M03_00320 [Candidatus Theseobacter exili]|nr:hypothetical protein [Candidatus Theseobacter exili]